jgi:hypothetical protein
MFGRAGDRLSIDALIARYTGRPAYRDECVYWWPVILGQFAVAAFYFGGFYAKWSTPEFTYDLSWVFSDNLRNSVSLPWLIWGRDLPSHVEMIVNNPLVWKTAAFAHLATQALPMLAMLSLGRPWLRLMEGAIFVAGVFLLKAIMGFWNPLWILLAAFFVDWEYFLQKSGISASSMAIRAPRVRSANFAISYSAIFMAINFFVIFTRLDDSGYNRAYHFSAMTFYSDVAARRPYSEHHHYPFNYGEVIVTYSDGQQRKWYCFRSINSLYLSGFVNGEIAIKLAQQAGSIRAVAQIVQPLLGQKVADCERQIDLSDVETIDLYASVLHIPAFPARVRFDVAHRGLVGRYTVRTGQISIGAAEVVGLGNAVGVRMAAQGFESAQLQLLLANDPWKNAHPGPLLQPKGVWEGSLFRIDPDHWRALPAGWYPIVVRVREPNGRETDFWGGVVYR